MSPSKRLALMCSILFMIFSMVAACGGGGGGGGAAAPAPNLQVDQTAYDFGSVTVGKTATLQVTVTNSGNANLSVDGLTITDLVNFTISSGTCGSAPYTLTAGESCTVALTFTPTVVGAYSETLDFTSNDGSYSATLTGTGAQASALTVNLNQIDTAGCPDIKAYVTVTDQNDFLVDSLTATDFNISEAGNPSTNPSNLEFADTAALSMATAIVMDYSFSVTEDPVLVDAIENGALAFVDQMGTSDIGEIIKFAQMVEVTQAFTGDTALLQTAIDGLPGLGTLTALYDAIYKGIEDAALQTTARKAVILLTDGVDYGGASNIPGSVHTKQEVIDLAKSEGIPVFTIGVGTGVDPVILAEIADETGGQFFDSPDTDRLITIYTQLSEVLNNQYVLTYTSTLSGSSVAVQVEVPDQAGVTGDTSDPLTYAGCP